jgi:acyl-CoA dehydrogenase
MNTPVTDSDQSHLEWPFFEGLHREVASRARALGRSLAALAPHAEDRATVDATCRRYVAELGRSGLTRYCVKAESGGALPELDARAICLIRETLAFYDGLADFAFAMQGLGSGAISLAGDAPVKARYLPRVAEGRAIAAFALSEPEAGSDVAAMRCAARPEGSHYVLDGEKTWISNGGIADFYCVFVRTAAATRRADGSIEPQGITAFVVDADTPGFDVSERIDTIAPHPLGRLTFRNCRVPATQRIGEEGEGFRLAMQTLDVFRTSVAAAALGFARRALAEALAYASQRELFGQRLADLQLTQSALAEMATQIDAAALLTYRAAWQRDRGKPVTREAAMAKLTATESAQRIIDRALQMFGGRGVVRGATMERLYREIRALRIYEGATEVQQLIIARELLKGHRA